jgi:carbamate kinase
MIISVSVVVICPGGGDIPVMYADEPRGQASH